MADKVMRTQAVRMTRPANPISDRIFVSFMIVLLWATVLWGFARTYFLAGMLAAPLPNRLVHIHGAVFTFWMIFVVIQEVLIAGKKFKWHKQLGLAGFGLAVCMVVLGLLTATDSMRRGVTKHGLSAETFYVVPMTTIVMFAILIYCAYRARFRPAAHKRLILIATIDLVGAAIGRLPVAALQNTPQLQSLVTLGFLLLIVAYDLISLKRIQKSTIWASLLLIVVQLVRVPIAMTPAWHAFATFMGGHA